MNGEPLEFKGISLTLNPKTEAECERLFNALADGGQVFQPLIKTFFSPKFGVVADKFGVNWMVLVEQTDGQRRPDDSTARRTIAMSASRSRHQDEPRLRHLARVRRAARDGVEVLHRGGARGEVVGAEGRHRRASGSWTCAPAECATTSMTTPDGR